MSSPNGFPGPFARAEPIVRTPVKPREPSRSPRLTRVALVAACFAFGVLGALGIATTTLFWLYIVARLVIAGAILNTSVHEQRSEPGRG